MNRMEVDRTPMKTEKLAIRGKRPRRRPQRR